MRDGWQCEWASIMGGHKGGRMVVVQGKEVVVVVGEEVDEPLEGEGV